MTGVREKLREWKRNQGGRTGRTTKGGVSHAGRSLAQGTNPFVREAGAPFGIDMDSSALFHEPRGWKPLQATGTLRGRAVFRKLKPMLRQVTAAAICERGEKAMKFLTVCVGITILMNVSFRTELMAQQIRNHVVPVEELQQRLVAQSAERSRDIQDIRKLLRHDVVQAKLGKLVDLNRIEVSLATLDNETLNQIAANSRSVNDQIEAGMATWGWVVIAIIAACTIVVVVGTITVLD